MEEKLANNELEILKAFPRHKAISFDCLPYCDGNRMEALEWLIKRGFAKRDTYFNCWITFEGKQFLKENEHA